MGLLKKRQRFAIPFNTGSATKYVCPGINSQSRPARPGTKLGPG